MRCRCAHSSRASRAGWSSYDDGTTWEKAKVTRHHGGWRARGEHPADARFVSLRSSVSDRDGNAQRQTVIRAYALT